MATGNEPFTGFLSPKAEEIRARLLADILAGTCPAGSRLPTEREMAKSFGVGRNTLRAALASLEVDGRVTRLAGRGTFVRPSPSAPQPNRRVLAHVGVVFLKYTDPNTDPLTREMFASLATVLREAGFVMTTYCLHSAPGDDYKRIVDDLDGMGFDLIVITPQPTTREMMRLAERATVLQLGYGLPTPEGSLVAGDLLAGTRSALKALAELGHRRVAMLTVRGADSDEILQAKIDAFREAVPQIGLDGAECPVVDRADMARLFAPGGPTAVLASMTRMARTFLDAAHERGVSIPRDMSLISYDDGAVGETTSPRFSGIKVVSAEMGRIGAKAVIDVVKGYRSLPVRELLQPELIMRDTCATAP